MAPYLDRLAHRRPRRKSHPALLGHVRELLRQREPYVLRHTCLHTLEVVANREHLPAFFTNVLVQNVNDPPACGRARAHPWLLWPPNHKLVPVTITGHRWGPLHRMTTTVTRVTQDEPVTGLGGGDTGPDAVIHGSKVLMRAERSGSGNGRVYRLHFTARNEHGDTCTGSADVWVPKSLKAGLRDVIDDGQLYDSTQR